ncbi:MAG: phosphonate ABC transporter, permease protein PhnE [Chloroflexota bacterium]
MLNSSSDHRPAQRSSVPRLPPGTLPYHAADQPYRPLRRLRSLIIAVILIGLFIGAARLAEVDLGKLLHNLSKIGQWVRLMFPPYDSNFRQPPTVDEWLYYLKDGLQTVAIATVGVTVAAVLAIIPAIFATRTLTPSRWLYYPTRWFLNSLRAIDSFIFALYFVAAVGLGPFAGVLGVALHTWGSMAKLYAEALENLELAPMLALESAGTGRIRALIYALLPDAYPVLISVTLFWWEFTVRASIALGIVGAGGIGQDVKNAIDLLNFPQLGALILIIVVMVTIIDQLSNWLRQAVQ